MSPYNSNDVLTVTVPVGVTILGSIVLVPPPTVGHTVPVGRHK